MLTSRSALLMLTASLSLAGCSDASPSLSLFDNPELREVVVLQVARDGGALARLVTEGDAAVRARAALALASVQDQGAAPALIDALDDDDARVRAMAAFALGQLPQMSGDVEGALVERAQSDPDTLVRVRAVEALGKVGRPTASDALARLDPAGVVGAAAAMALSRMVARGTQSPAGLDALLARLTDVRAEVRRDAAWGLGHSFQPGFWQGRRDAVYAALDGYEKTDEAAADLLRALGWIQDPAGRARLLDWLASAPDWRIRAAAAEAMLATPHAAERAALFAALADSAVQVRIVAATSLGARPLEGPDLDRIEAWIAQHPDQPQVAGPLLVPLAWAGRAQPLLRWIGGIAPDDALRWRHAIAAADKLPGDGAIRSLAAAAASGVPAISGNALQTLALRWARGDRGGPASREVFYGAFTEGLRRRDPMTAPILAEVLTDSIFRAMGSEAVIAEVGVVPEPPIPPLTGPDWMLLEDLGERPRFVLDTEAGTVVAELNAAEAPVTVQTIARLAREGRFDGVPFHRVVPAFMVQGGDFTRGDGTGDPGFRLPTEVTTDRYLRGTLGMARFEKDTETSQFFVTQSMQPHLDGGYTAFGRVVEGMEVVDRILEGQRILTARVDPGPPAS